MTRISAATIAACIVLFSFYFKKCFSAVLRVGLVRSFVRYCGQGSSLLWTPALRPLYRSNALAQGKEGIDRCVRCMCELCRVEKELSRREQLVRYF